MFGTKIRSWMEAHLARSRNKRKERGKPESQPAQPQQQRSAFDQAFFTARADLNEILPSLAISSFKPQAGHRDGPRPHQQQAHRQPQQQLQHKGSQPHHPASQQQQQRYENGSGKVAGSAVNLSSPESAYSTGYSTDGTSPCATYAPEYYINVRQQQQQQAATLRQPYLQGLEPGLTQTRPRPRRIVEERTQAPPPTSRHCDRQQQQLDGTGTYTVSRARYERELYAEQQQNPWRKPAPPTSSRPPTGSPRIHSPGHLGRKPYSSSPLVGERSAGSPVPPSYPLQLFSPRRMPLVATTTTQVMPVKSPRQRSRLRTSPWQSRNAVAASAAAAMAIAPRAWTRQSYDYCCRQESLSVGRSPVNRSDWRAGQPAGRQQVRSRTRSSSASSCSSRSRSCSVSSSNSPSNASSYSSTSSDDATLNEVMGKFEEGYSYEKETDIVSDHSAGENRSSSLNFSSDEATASSLELLEQIEPSAGSSRSTSRSRRQLRGLAGRRHRRRRQRHCSTASSRDDEDAEQRDEVELLQEILNRRLKKNKGEVSAQTNRALLERLLMKSGGFEGRRAWSAHPAPQPSRSAASRSLGGTPICLRRRAQPRHLLSPPSRLAFERHRQVYPAESTSSLKNMSASELALIEADKEADLKYAQLIMEAERMLLSAQEELEREESVASSRRGSTASVVGPDSPTRINHLERPYPQSGQQACTGLAPNKRVELIKNAELNIELALSKSRNSQPELSSGSIKDLLDHSSPKRLLQQQQQKKIVEPMISQAASTMTSDTMAFKSLDMPGQAVAMPRSSAIGATASTATSTCNELGSEHYAYCPQSEPVKRKVYEAHPESKLLQPPPWLRNSDTDFASEVPQLQSSSAASSYSQLRKHMLIETLQGLKQSLEDQSATLKMSCLRPL